MIFVGIDDTDTLETRISSLAKSPAAPPSLTCR
jgi:hypothetical protein